MLTKSVFFLKHSRCIHYDFSSSRIGILGVPFDKGQQKFGVAQGPKYLRDAGLIQQLQDLNKNLDVKDYGDASYTIDPKLKKGVPNMKNYEHIVSCAKIVSDKVCNIIKDNRICLTLGGDHAISIGSVDGHLKAKPDNVAILWVDAHADLNTNLTSESGNIHGMPMSILAKELSDYWPYMPGLDWQMPAISLRNVAYIGLRSVDPYEHLIINKVGMTAFYMDDVERLGIDTVVNMALKKIDPYQNKSIHVSFDIDCLDTSEAPSTGTSVRGGLLLREGVHIMNCVHNTGRLGAVDLVEVNPSIGTEDDVKCTVNAAIHILLSAFGYNRRTPAQNIELPLQTFPPKQGVI